MITTRTEQEGDSTGVRSVNKAAFSTSFEADLVDALRKKGRDTISLVAEQSSEIVGHIMFSPANIEQNPQNKHIYGLAPMAVRPNLQRQGIGSALVKAGLQACAEHNIDIVVVLGHPEYYPRFGFEKASIYNISCSYEVPDEAFMVIALNDGALNTISGTVTYHPLFDQSQY